MGAGAPVLLVCEPTVLVKKFEAAVNDVEGREAGASGGEDDRDSDARDRAAAFCNRAGLEYNGELSAYLSIEMVKKKQKGDFRQTKKKT